jgi:beta-glucosidase
MTDLTDRVDAPEHMQPPVDERFRDSSLPLDERVEILLAQMTIEEKVGLLFHPMITVPNPEADDAAHTFGYPGEAETHDYVTNRLISHMNVMGSGESAQDMAEWQNKVQDLAKTTRLGIPITLSTDPRHSFSDNPLAAIAAGPFSEWPEPLGLAAIADEDVVEQFGDIARQEYTAVGIRVGLHPQIDLATEPRWGRQLQTFGEDADLTSRLGAAYVRGFQGTEIGPGSVETMVKHFPGGGPQMDGEDCHFEGGREQVYPGDNFEHHLKPFKAAFDAGARQVMPYYGMPVGTQYEEVGFGFNKGIITSLLRERFGFDGIVCTDWGLINDVELAGVRFAARAWGVEHLTPRERMLKVLNAGADQFGGEHGTEMLAEIVRSGGITESRIDESARRLLREKFRLGLFDNPYVDPDRAAQVAGNEAFRAAGLAAQRASVTLLTNGVGAPVLPLAHGISIYAEGIDLSIVSEFGRVVEDPTDADIAILRLPAPFEPREGVMEALFHQGSLEFTADTIQHVRSLAGCVPVVVEIFLERPAILGPIVDAAAAVVATYGTNSRALLEVLFGDASPQGKLPFDVPSSMEAVLASRPDVPFDTKDPLFRFGHGLRYSGN